MKRAAKVLVWAIGIYGVLVLGSGLAIQALLSGGRIDALTRSINERAPVTVSVGEGSFDLVQWLRFQPVIKLKKIVVSNPPGFPAGPLLTVDEAGAQVELFSLFQSEVRILRVELRGPVLNIVSDAKGNPNVAVLAAAKGKGAEKPGKSAAIDALSVTGGTVRYQGLTPGAGLVVRDIELSLSDFGSGRTSRLTLGARLFGGKVSRFDFQGQAGPASAGSLPAQGALTLVLAPAEIPKTLRVQYLGEPAADPPPGSRITFAAEMRGDAMKSLAGKGDLQFKDFAIGRAKDVQLPLGGAAPFHVSLSSLLGSPVADVSAEGASLRLGQGRWNGAMAARWDGARLTGRSNGSITGVKIEEMLRAFTTAKQSVSGLAEIPEYSIQFAGKNAAEIQNSLAGAGQISLKDGKVAMFDLLGSIEAKLQNALSGDAGKPGATDFVTLTSRFEIANGQVTLPNLVLQGPASGVDGQGYFKFDHALSFDLMTDVSGSLAAKLKGKPDSTGVAHLRVPVKVRGTLESPKVYPDVAGMAKAVAVEKATGLIDSFLKKRLGTSAPK